jgi:hypothetical protein
VLEKVLVEVVAMADEEVLVVVAENVLDVIIDVDIELVEVL